MNLTTENNYAQKPNMLMLLTAAIFLVSLGVFIGYLIRGRQPISEKKSNKFAKEITKNPQPTDKLQTIDLLNLSFDEFGVVTIYRDKTASIEGSFWNKKINTNIDAIQSELGDQLINYITQQNGVGSLTFVGGNANRYFFIEPDGYKTISLVTENDINKKANYSDTSAYKKVTCNKSSKHSNPHWIAIQCNYTYYDGTTNIIRDENNTTSCFIPIENSNKYLAFEQPQKGISSSVNLCEGLQRIGVQLILSKNSKTNIYKTSPDIN